MELTRVFAYQVEPRRTAGHDGNAIGGVVAPSVELEGSLQTAATRARLENQTIVDFRLDVESRTCEVRDALISLGFFGNAQAEAAAELMARRLSAAMDLRSKSCLFVAAVEEADAKRRITYGLSLAMRPLDFKTQQQDKHH